MPLQIIVGTQWGDEGKGRIVDWFAASSDVTARYNRRIKFSLNLYRPGDFLV